ncbi:uncharacterized protein SCHCODRAFT_02500552 [Schizophyllum commune H4-8]|nr:uncharacterized protein SCHCODRAFT_02500552 [Schizophyllum commune H4-8]KAI5894271.1 hypothetical protein SCHCODRAFT_02500552 [Schizophyllum commune H4-8]
MLQEWEYLRAPLRHKMDELALEDSLALHLRPLGVVCVVDIHHHHRNHPSSAPTLVCTKFFRFDPYVEDTMASGAPSDASGASEQNAPSVFAACFDEVPNELLRIIFRHACDDIPLLLPPIPPNPLSAPPTYPALVVSWVCHRWRELAISTPELWAPTIYNIKEQQLGPAPINPARGDKRRPHKLCPPVMPAC